MDKIKTYIVNLPASTKRRDYMTSLLEPYTFLDVEFIEATDGRKMTQEEREAEFDYAGCMRHMGRQPNAGEIGCVLSHRKCCRRLLESDESYALIVEDDIAIIRDLSHLPEYDIAKHLLTDRPTVLFLSGDFWYFKRADVVKAYDAVGAYAYFINRGAAQLILSTGKPRNVADDWRYYKYKGLKLRGILPYMVDANVDMANLPSDVNQDSWTINRREMSAPEAFRSYWSGLVKRILKATGRFEAKTRIIDNKIISAK